MLRVPIKISIDLVPKFILATAILHNVGKHLNDTYDADSDFVDDDGGEDSDDEDGYQSTNTIVLYMLAAFLLDLSTNNKAQVHLENVLHAIFVKCYSFSFF